MNETAVKKGADRSSTCFEKIGWKQTYPLFGMAEKCVQQEI